MTSINAIAGKNYSQTKEINAAKEKVTFQMKQTNANYDKKKQKFFETNWTNLSLIQYVNTVRVKFPKRTG